jgi:hypothetical protein
MDFAKEKNLDWLWRTLYLMIIGFLLLLIFGTGFRCHSHPLPHSYHCRLTLKSFGEAIKMYEVVYHSKPFHYSAGEAKGACRIDVQDIARLLDPKNPRLTDGTPPPSQQDKIFFEVTDKYINANGQFVDLWGNEFKILIEISRPFSGKPFGKELRILLYSVGPNGIDETDLRENKDDVRIYKEELNFDQPDLKPSDDIGVEIPWEIKR